MSDICSGPIAMPNLVSAPSTSTGEAPSSSSLRTWAPRAWSMRLPTKP